MSIPLPPKPKIDIRQYLNHDGSIKRTCRPVERSYSYEKSTQNPPRLPPRCKDNVSTLPVEVPYRNGVRSVSKDIPPPLLPSRPSQSLLQCPLQSPSQSPIHSPPRQSSVEQLQIQSPPAKFPPANSPQANSHPANSIRVKQPPTKPSSVKPVPVKLSVKPAPPQRLPSSSPPKSFPPRVAVPAPHHDRSASVASVETVSSISSHSVTTNSGRTYAPKPVNSSVPLITHSADHRAPPQVPTSFLKTKTHWLLAANDRFTFVTTSSKTQLYSWRSSSLVWELKGASTAAAFVPATESIWVSPATSTGKISVLSIHTGKLLCDLGRGHMKCVTFLANTKYGVVSLSADDGKLNVWKPTLKDRLPIITQRTPLKSGLAASGGPQSDILWTCSDHQVNAYCPSLTTLPFVSVFLPRRGANLGAITSIASFDDMAFFGQNDGFISVFKGPSQLGYINGGIYSITALTATSGYELWAGTRYGDILIFALHITDGKGAHQLSATMLRQWKAHPAPIVQILSAESKAAVLSTDRQGTVLCWNSTPTDVVDSSPSLSQGHRVQVLTWNVGNCTPQNIEHSWFVNKETIESDILVVGLQEVVNLERTSQHALNLLSNGDAVPDGEHNQWQKYLETIYIPHGFTLMTMKPLVGLMVCLFVKNHLASTINQLSTQVVRTGIKGAYGNKGALIVTFQMSGMSWCFVNCHLAAGHSSFVQRNRDATQILTTQGIFQSDVCFFFGDTNYRISAAREQTEELIKIGNWEQLHRYDQLMSQISQLPSFSLGRFREGPLNFAPTYKYDPGTNVYDTSDKHRVPAWCDRILYRGKSITLLNYSDVDTKSSDHKAVVGSFHVPQLYQI